MSQFYDHVPYQPDYFPNGTPAGFELHVDIEYGSVGGRPLKLDIARINTGVKMPTLLHMFGGAWMSGDHHLRHWNRELILAGFCIVSVGYRLSHEAIFPVQLEDCKTGMRWIRAHADEYNFDLDRIGAWGYSSGGHLAALMATTAGAPGFSTEGGWAGFPDHAKAVVDYYGPTDFNCMPHMSDNPESPICRLVGGLISQRQEIVAAANPINYISDKTPPMLILHGEEDRAVTINQSELLYDALKKAGRDVEFVRVKNAGHDFKGENIQPSWQEIENMVVRFFKKYL